MQNHNCVSSRHLYIIRIDNKLSKLKHKNIFSKLREFNIGVNLHYIPIHLQPYYKKLDLLKDNSQAEKYYQEAISLPIFTKLTKGEQNYVIETLKKLILMSNICIVPARGNSKRIKIKISENLMIFQ